MKIPDILDLDWNTVRSMNRRELSKIVSSMASAANKRLRRFEQANDVSPAVRYAEKGGGKFSVAGKNVNQLRAEFVRAKTFLQEKTSTVRQWNRVMRETQQTLADMDVHIPREDLREVMKIYGSIKTDFPDIQDSAIYAPAIQEIYNRMQAGQSADQIKDAARSMMVEGYENREAANNAFDVGGVSDFI